MIKSKCTEILELVSKAQSDFFGAQGEMTNRFLTFNAYGYDICNPFLDEFMISSVEPIQYYGNYFLESDLLKNVKIWVDKYEDLSSKEIAEKIIKYITYDNYKECIKGK